MNPTYGGYSDEDDRPCSRRPGGGPCEFLEDDKNAEMVCRFCGRVGRRILSTAQAKVFEHGDEKNLHADEGKQFGQLGTRMGSVYTANASALNPGLVGRDRTIQFDKKRTAKDKTADSLRHELENQCTRMKLIGKTTNDALELFDFYVRNVKTLPKNQKVIIMLGVIFYACKINNDTRTVQELARQTGREPSEVRNGVKLISNKCGAFLTRDKVEPSKLISRHCEQLGMKSELTNMFVNRAIVVDEHIHQYLEGKKPKTVAATDMALTYKWFFEGQLEWDEATIAEKLDLKPATLRKSIVKVEEEMRANGKTVKSIIDDADERFPSR